MTTPMTTNNIRKMPVVLTEKVKPQWVDYNNHLNDAEYARVFSMALEEFLLLIGFDEDFRRDYQYTVFTLENHICYLKEALLGEELQVGLQILDFDEKRIHLFFTMINAPGELLSTSEQMIMGINIPTGKPEAFPDPLFRQIKSRGLEDQNKEKPPQAGRVIKIRRK